MAFEILRPANILNQFVCPHDMIFLKIGSVPLPTDAPSLKLVFEIFQGGLSETDKFSFEFLYLIKEKI